MSDALTPHGHPGSGAGASAGGHTITISGNNHRVRVIHGGVTMADTQAGLTLSETGLPDVFYFPREHVNMARWNAPGTRRIARSRATRRIFTCARKTV